MKSDPRSVHVYRRIFLSIVFLLSTAALCFAAESADVKKMVFDAQKIEGKIRRPQLVLIKADQRPEFTPMAIQSFGKNRSIVEFVDKSVIEKFPYAAPFKIEGTKIVGVLP